MGRAPYENIELTRPVTHYDARDKAVATIKGLFYMAAAVAY